MSPLFLFHSTVRCCIERTVGGSSDTLQAQVRVRVYVFVCVFDRVRGLSTQGVEGKSRHGVFLVTGG